MKTSIPTLTLLVSCLLLAESLAGNHVLLADVAQPGPTFTVNTTDEHDDGVCGMDDCTLREAIITANADGDTNEIVFASALTGTITTNQLDPGGGIPITAPVTITGPGARLLTISGNHLARAFFVFMAQVEIADLTMEDCAADEGGAIYNFGDLTLIDCTLTGNTATNMTFGGAIFGQNGSTTTLVGCTFSDNIAEEGGGAVFGGSYLTMTNCTFFNNSAAFGGAILDTGPALLTNCTIVGNHASDAFTAGGVDAGPTCEIGSCIIAGNTDGDMASPDVFGFLVSLGYNLIGAKSSNNSFIDGVNHDHVGTVAAPLDPGLDPTGLQNDGGPTDTIALLPDSLAVNAGDPVNAPERDQRDYDRTNAPDIGAFEPGATTPKTLANISTRLLVETGDKVLIGGFIVTGSHSKEVLLRAIGPSLTLDGKLANPVLELHDASGAVVATNDDWQANTNEQEIVGTGIAPTDPLESALLVVLDPGAYTAIVSGANNGTGIGLVEAYDLDRTTDARLANISTRGFVQAGDNVMIGGFIILGSEDENVLVRAIGPSLPLADTLADPLLELHNSDGSILATNDNWRDTQEAEIEATGVAPTNDAESAIVSTLAPGNYTAIVRGVGDTTGVALVEAYGLN